MTYPRWLIGTEQLLLTIWVGSQLAIGYLAVPLLFQNIENRYLAGEIAGQMFHWVHYLGLACGLLLLVISLKLGQHVFWRQWRNRVLLLMLLLIVVGLFILQPQMAVIKLQADWREQAELMSQFGRLHGIASVVYLLTSVMGIVLVVKGLRRV